MIQFENIFLQWFENSPTKYLFAMLAHFKNQFSLTVLRNALKNYYTLIIQSFILPE